MCIFILVFAGDVELLELMMNDDNYLLLFGAFECRYI